MESRLKEVHNRALDAQTEEEWAAVEAMVRGLPVEAELTGLPAAPNSLNSLAHVAARANKVEVLRGLHSKNYNLRQRNARNMTPLALAMRQKTDCRQVISFALESSYSPIERLFYGGDDSDVRMMNEFSRHPEAINDALHEYNEMTWLCICVEEARFAQAEWLIQHGADVSVRDVCGNTLLHMLPFQSAVNTAWASSDHSFSGLREAAYADDQGLTDPQMALLSFMTTLLSNAAVAASVDVCNDLGDAAVHVIAETSPDPRFALWAIKILKDHGATVELENQDGSNVGMLIARSFGQGVWLDLVYEQLSGLDRAAADAGGERLEDYIVDADVDELSSEDISVAELSEGSMGFDDHL